MRQTENKQKTHWTTMPLGKWNIVSEISEIKYYAYYTRYHLKIDELMFEESINYLTKFIDTTIEPRHDKTNKVSVRPAKTQISLGIHPVWSVFAVRMKKPWVLTYPMSAQRRLWSDWADAQADLNLRWVHTHFVGFVMRRLNHIKVAERNRWGGYLVII